MFSFSIARGRTMFHILSIVLGVLIAVMLTINSQFSLILGNFQSALIIHLVGLGILIPVLLLAGKRAKRERVPFYLLTAGVIGVALIFLNNICFNTIGASLSVSLIILGQTLAGQIIDVTGFLGMEKHPFHKGKLFGWILVIAGAAVMTGGSSGNAIYLFLALISGALVMLSTVINAQLAKRVGLLRGTSVNYAAGLVTAIVILLIMGSRPSEFAVIPSIHPLLIFGGGVLGVIIVSGLSTVVPRIPAVYSTILIFIGQVGAGLVLDYYILDSFAWLQAAGAVVIALGLLSKILVDVKEQKKAAALLEAAA
ncbi:MULTISPECIES: DMT family transporter [unclassified Oceanispirochaeta]|uniref:DMT family transporter n=1 Tax=unclassified Oceanispirochaeta TaxID=2635722 RepID=UPI000E093944|nr:MULTISPECIES: DMT family transporter [unclassified Oceanispirochaeta]MBF9016330.1 DMT family transporter [Oceanispirochaeta sp. M2]NPD72793.1 DMT family transporter [Oceanispirochaeta sp. M1]RDG31637.1 DMT family transporter [Oceanispirochaeta sp. M1]